MNLNCFLLTRYFQLITGKAIFFPSSFDLCLPTIVACENKKILLKDNREERFYYHFFPPIIYVSPPRAINIDDGGNKIYTEVFELK